jgi:hypothetical protein
MARRRFVKLPHGGRFVFTPKTVSLDVSAVCSAVGFPGGRNLHVNRTSSILEVENPETGETGYVSLDLNEAATVLSREQTRRSEAGEPDVSTLFEPRVWRAVQQQARHLRAARRSEIPFADRTGRLCFETVGGHPGESLWLDPQTGEAAIETRVDELDAKGRPAGYSTRARFVSAAEAIDWLTTDGPRFLPTSTYVALRDRIERDREINNGPQPSKGSGRDGNTKRDRT